MIATVAHKLTAFLLVFILFAHNINTLVIIGDFMANQAMIAKNLCVQKDNQLGCNGKCHLSKQLKQSNPDSNSDVPTQETRRMSLDAFCLFDIQTFGVKNRKFQKVQTTIFGHTPQVLVRYQDIETPPPNFS